MNRRTFFSGLLSTVAAALMGGEFISVDPKVWSTSAASPAPRWLAPEVASMRFWWSTPSRPGTWDLSSATIPSAKKVA